MYSDENFLAHHGVLGQRWGVRRYQNSDGSLTALGRKRRGIKSERSTKSKITDKIKKASANYKKQKAKNVKTKSEEEIAAEKAKKEAEKREKLKKHIRSHPNSLYKHRNELTREEVNDLIDQIQWDRKVADIKFDEFRRFNTRAKEFSSSINTMASIMKNGIDVYNNTALIYNTLIDQQVADGTRSKDDAKKIVQMAWPKNNDGKKKESKKKGNNSSDDDDDEDE